MNGSSAPSSAGFVIINKKMKLRSPKFKSAFHSGTWDQRLSQFLTPHSFYHRCLMEGYGKGFQTNLDPEYPVTKRLPRFPYQCRPPLKNVIASIYVPITSSFLRTNYELLVHCQSAFLFDGVPKDTETPSLGRSPAGRILHS